MTKEELTAIARIVSDMIKADNIIEESEIADMKEIMSYYRITNEHMKEARHMRFSDAVNVLTMLSRQKREVFYEMIRKLALSDGLCVPKEVLLLIALKYCLVNREEFHGEQRPYLINCPTSESALTDQYMVYLESDFNRARNEEINQIFRPLVDATSFRGFNFIYIPRMVEEFKAMNPQYVKDVIGYMAPSKSSGQIEEVYSRLCQMSTEEFFHNVLYDKLKVKMDYNSPPTLLINIGCSYVPYCTADGTVQYYTEFLCIPLGNRRILDLVYELLDFYQQNISIRTLTVAENPGQFKYFGFYKALFDFLIAPQPVVPYLIFAPEGSYGKDRNKKDKNRKIRNCIIFRVKDENDKVLYDEVVELTPKRYKLYLDIAEATFSSASKGLHTSRVDSSNLSHLRKLILKKQQEKAFPDLYRPEKVGNFYKLLIERKKVKVLDVLTGKETSL
ncbi:MAG: hypothetical protein HDS33_07820 [Bacteroides sp.]|nr:hypothetical protein [Bacteroides sp.]